MCVFSVEERYQTFRDVVGPGWRGRYVVIGGVGRDTKSREVGEQLLPGKLDRDRRRSFREGVGEVSQR